MNPSATGWIKKLLRLLESNTTFQNYDEREFYNHLQDSGFLYGTNLNILGDIFSKKGLTEEEMSKVNLCLTFLYTHYKNGCQTNFVESIIGFYKSINEHKLSFFKELLSNTKANEHLEAIIHNRIQIDDNVVTKNFNYFLINGLLYVDVIAYEAYIKDKSVSLDYIKNLEASIEAVSLKVIDSKEQKTTYDEGLIRLFKSSMRHKANKQMDYYTALSFIKTKNEKLYIFDLACMATWSDKIIEIAEQKFLFQLATDLGLTLSEIDQSIKSVNGFYSLHKDNIALFSSKNAVQSFYDNSSKIVIKLITRNSQRLYKELVGSKELMVLLTKSTVRDLNKDEQKKVQEQLLDIFKSIPSLAIFLLPGGMLLLPIVIKFIPKLLPSAFDENRIED